MKSHSPPTFCPIPSDRCRNHNFLDSCFTDTYLTAWTSLFSAPFISRCRPHISRAAHLEKRCKKGTLKGAFCPGAGDGARTRYLHLGKVALYQMSYARRFVCGVPANKWCLRSELNQRHADFQSAALPTELQRHTGHPEVPYGDSERARTVDLQRDRLAF